jgi:hypothetical protein
MQVAWSEWCEIEGFQLASYSERQARMYPLRRSPGLYGTIPHYRKTVPGVPNELLHRRWMQHWLHRLGRVPRGSTDRGCRRRRCDQVMQVAEARRLAKS